MSPDTLSVQLRYYPNQSNPQHASGRGVWRVVHVWDVMFPRPRVRTSCNGLLTIVTMQAVKPRSRVNPRHLLGV